MTRNEIITELFKSKDFNDCINRMDPPHLRDDLRQEIITIVCEWPAAKVEDLAGRKELNIYVVRVILNQIQSKTSPFFKKYRAREYDEVNWHGEEINGNYKLALKICTLPEVDIDEERKLREELEDFTLAEIERAANSVDGLLYWYNARILLLYMKLGTFRKVQEETRIPYISCYKTVKKSLALLKQKRLAPVPVPLFTKQELKSINGNTY